MWDNKSDFFLIIVSKGTRGTEITGIRKKKVTRKKVRRQVGKKVTRKKVAGKKVTIYFFHIYYTPESHSMYNE